MPIAYGHTHTLEQLGVQIGTVELTPTANAISSVKVAFPKPYSKPPSIVIVSPVTTVPYTTVRYATAAEYTETGFTLYLYRTTSTFTVVNWMAVGV